MYNWKKFENMLHSKSIIILQHPRVSTLLKNATVKWFQTCQNFAKRLLPHLWHAIEPVLLGDSAAERFSKAKLVLFKVCFWNPKTTPSNELVKKGSYFPFGSCLGSMLKLRWQNIFMRWYSANKKSFMSVIFLNMKINAASIRVFFPNGPTEKNNFQRVECSRRIAQKYEENAETKFWAWTSSGFLYNSATWCVAVPTAVYTSWRPRWFLHMLCKAACSKDKSVKCQIFAIPGCYCMEQFGCLVGASLSPHTGSYITVNDIVLGGQSHGLTITRAGKEI